MNVYIVRTPAGYHVESAQVLLQGSNLTVTIKREDLESEKVYNLDVADLIAASSGHTSFVQFGRNDGVLDLFKRTLPAKVSMREFGLQINDHSSFHVLVPSVSSTVNECGLVIALPAGVTPELSGVTLAGDNLSSLEAVLPLVMPKIVIGEPVVAGSAARFPIAITAADGDVAAYEDEIYIESTIGSCLTARVKLVNGAGEAIVDLSNLPAGIAGKVKAGFKYYSGVTSKEFTV